MIINNRRTMNFTAESVKSESSVPITVMSAYVNANGNVGFNQDISDMAYYNENIEIADADFEEFKKYVLDVIN